MSIGHGGQNNNPLSLTFIVLILLSRSSLHTALLLRCLVVLRSGDILARQVTGRFLGYCHLWHKIVREPFLPGTEEDQGHVGMQASPPLPFHPLPTLSHLPRLKEAMASEQSLSKHRPKRQLTPQSFPWPNRNSSKTPLCPTRGLQRDR